MAIEAPLAFRPKRKGGRRPAGGTGARRKEIFNPWAEDGSSFLDAVSSMSLSHALRMPPARSALARQLGSFALVGGLGFAVDLAATLALTQGAGLPAMTAKPGGIFCGLFVTFLLNRRFTFRSRSPAEPRRRPITPRSASPSGSWRRWGRICRRRLAWSSPRSSVRACRRASPSRWPNFTPFAEA